VAEHVLGLLLSGSRHIPWYHQAMRDGAWPEPEDGVHHRLHGRTLGLLGLGRIGHAVAERARAFGLTVIAHDPFRTDEQLRASGVEPVSLDTLLAASDYISLHTPLTDNTRHLVNAESIAAMKPGTAVINASRGLVVDTPALLDALNSRHLAWAALDVYEAEPLVQDSPLRTCPYVILTPHLAGFSEEAWRDLRAEMCLTTRQWKQTGWADRVINPGVRARLRGAGQE